MGFFSSIFKGAKSVVKSVLPIAGSVLGQAYGGPIGGAIGGSLGSAVTSNAPAIGGAIGQGLAGTISSGDDGGLTKPAPTGAQQGKEARAYYDEAFPGTNPWERLGPSAPMGRIASTAMTADNQNRMNRRTLTSQQNINSNQVAQQRYQTQVSGRAAAVSAAAQWGGQYTKQLSDLITKGKMDPSDPGLPTQSATERVAQASADQADVAKRRVTVDEQRVKFQQEASRIKSAKDLGNIAQAVEMGQRLKNWRMGMQDSSWDKFMRNHIDTLKSVGVGLPILSAMAKAAGFALGSAKFSKLLKGRTSVPAVAR